MNKSTGLKLSRTSSLTPIEVALGIDENGMTTAKNLYEFLQLNPSNYSKWYKANILENQFAEKGIDYEVFVPKDENGQGGRPTQDFKLTAKFAKKLSMTQKNERGEQAREYFTRVEEGAKEMVLKIQDLSPELQAVFVVDKRVTTAERRIDNLENTMNIDYAQQKQLRAFVNEVVVAALGGRDSAASNYKDENGVKLKPRVYSRIWHDFYDYFNINAYANLPRARFKEALEYINRWQPSTNMQLEIGKINRENVA